MIDRLNYEVTPNGLKIDVPKRVHDSALNRYGAMLDELRQTPAQQLIERTFSADGVTLFVDTSKIAGINHIHKPQEARAERVLDAILQLDGVAEAEDGEDPRVLVRPPGGDALMSVTIDKPTAPVQELVNQALSSIRLHGSRMGYFRSQADEGRYAKVVIEPDQFYKFSAESFEYAKLTGASSLLYVPTDEGEQRVRLQERQGKVSQRAQLATLMGVYSILPR